MIAFDTETCLIRPGALAPELVCMTCAGPDTAPMLEHWTGVRPHIETWLRNGTLLVGAHVAFDLAVLCQMWPDLIPAVFEHYEKDLVTDVLIRQQLLNLAAGTFKFREVRPGVNVRRQYDLATVAKSCCGMILKKDGSFRLKYGTVRNLPVEEWPREAIEYATDDAIATWKTWEAQEESRRHEEMDLLADEFRQARFAWWAYLMSVWGLRTDARLVAQLAEKTAAERERVKERLVELGLVRPDGSRNLKEAKAHMQMVCARDNLPIALTDKGGICLDKDACAQTGDLVLKDYSAYVTLGDMLGRGITALQSGTVYPIHTRFNMAETGRRTSSGPNIQNWGRKPGPRECFIPRPGKVFAQGDYEQLELRTLAQVCICRFGKSRLADALNAGRDPHSELAASILGKSYEYVLEHKKDPEVFLARQCGKVGNFGLPVGLGVKTLVYYARKTYDTIITEEKAREIKATWLATWPEMSEFFEYHRRLGNNSLELGWLMQLFSERLHGGCRFTASCSSDSQGLGADAAGNAGFLIAKACYVGPGPLLGARPVCFVHDEFIAEVNYDETAHDAAVEMGRLMVVGAAPFVPDVPCKVEPQLMRVWSKEAYPVYDSRGRLVPWAPKEEHDVL